MQRVIHCEVAGSHARSDCHTAGVRGSANTTRIVLTFGPPWEQCTSITATFYDANGENPTVIPFLDGTKYTNHIDGMRYYADIPETAMAVSGQIQMVLDGYVAGEEEGTGTAGRDLDITLSEDVVELTDPTDDAVVVIDADTADDGMDIYAFGEGRLRAVETYQVEDAPGVVRDEWGTVQKTAVEALVEWLNQYVAEAEALTKLNAHPAKIMLVTEDDQMVPYWFVYNTDTGEYEKSVKAQGPEGKASGELSTGSVTEDHLADSLKATLKRYFYQANYYDGQREDVPKDGQYRLWTRAADNLTNDTEEDLFEIVTDPINTDDWYRYISVKKDMTVRISGQIALTLGNEKFAATHGLRSIHLWKIAWSGSATTKTQLVKSSIQDWNGKHGRAYTVNFPSVFVDLKAGDALFLVAYMKKHDSLVSKYTYFNIEAISVG